jgi:hypothetical protein
VPLVVLIGSKNLLDDDGNYHGLTFDYMLERPFHGNEVASILQSCLYAADNASKA